MAFRSPTPVLVVHVRTDAICSPEDAARAYERAGEPKDILRLPRTNHIDLYDVEQYVTPAVARSAAWFGEHLGRPAAADRAPAEARTTQGTA